MNRRSIFAIAATTTLALALLSSAAAETLQPVTHPEELGFDVARLERVTKAFQGYVDTGQLPGAVVLIARNDKVAYLRAFGYQDREKQITMTPDAIFRIASMTKPIISVGAMMLVEEGKLDIAAPVFQYLPEFKNVQVGVEKRDASTGNTLLVLEPQNRPMTAFGSEGPLLSPDRAFSRLSGVDTRQVTPKSFVGRFADSNSGSFGLHDVRIERTFA